MKAGELRAGAAVKMDGKLFVVIKYETTKPGKGPAYAQIKLKDVVGGGYLDRRFNTSDFIEDVLLDRRVMEYLYSDGSGAVFMDTVTYDQAVIPEDVLGDSLQFLRPNTQATVLTHEDAPITIELPAAVLLKVKDTAPGIKGATATNQAKPATMETGLQTKVPPFIEIDEELKISTVDGSYISRA